MFWSLFACQPPDDGATAVFSADTDGGVFAVIVDFGAPPATGPVTADLAVSRVDGAALGDAVVALDVYMPEHGHGVTPPPATTQTGEGAWTSEWVFPMAGTWELTLDVHAGGDTDARVFDVDVD